MKNKIYRNLIIIIAVISYSDVASQEKSLTMDFIENRNEFQMAYRLDIKGNNSLWIQTEGFSLIENKAKYDISYELSQFDNSKREYVYKDLVTKNMLSKYNLIRNFYLAEKVTPFDWKPLDSIETVLGYKCNSAQTSFRGRTYLAFYTVEIPLSNGPWKFHGLPGLILKITSIEDQYGDNFKMECIGIRENDEANSKKIDSFYEKEIKKNRKRIISSWENFVTEFAVFLEKILQFVKSSEETHEDYEVGTSTEFTLNGVKEIIHKEFQTRGVTIEH